MSTVSISEQIAFYKKFFEAINPQEFKFVTQEEIISMLAKFEQTLKNADIEDEA